MNEETIDAFLEQTGCFLESLIKSRKHLTGKLLSKLDGVIDAELDLALMGAEKAKSEILKANKEGNKLVPIKGDKS